MIPGHGEPFEDVAGSIATVRSKLEAFERDPAKNARHVAKVMFVFALLDRGSMPLADVAAYLESVPCYRELGERFLGQAPRDMAPWLLGDLQRGNAVSLRDAVLRPLMAA